MKRMNAKSQGSFRVLRRGLLGLLLVALAGLVGLYFLGRQGAPGDELPEEPPASGAPGVGPEAPDVVASSDAFDFTQAIEGKPIFKVHGDRFQTTREGKVELAGVRFEIFRDDVSYSVASDSATYDSNSQEALLTGNVQLAGGEMTVGSGRLQLTHGGKHLVAEGPIALRHGERWTGEASSLEFDVELDLLTMRGPVAIHGRLEDAQPVEIQAGKIVLDRQGRVLRALGEVTASHGASHFQSTRAEIFLAADGETPSMLVLDGKLSGTYIGAPSGEAGVQSGERVDFKGDSLSMQFGESGIADPQTMRLDGKVKNLALIESVNGDIIHAIASKGLLMELEGGRPRSASSQEPVYFAEYHRGVTEPVRSGRSDRAEAEFGAGGGVSRVVLIGGVTLSDPKFRGWGEQALFDFQEERSELLGAPARTEAEGGEFSSPHIVYARKSGVLTADRGVRGLLKGGRRGGGGAPATLAGVGFRGDQPVEFQADEAVFTDAPRGFLLKGKVRAWQGKSLLLADQLRGEEAEERLSAAGNVRTLIALRPSVSAGSAPATGAKASDPPAAAPAPAAQMTEVIAELLTYRKGEGTLTYSGGVRLTQGTRALFCDELVALLDTAGGSQQVRRMTGTGKVRLVDSAAGQSIVGSSAAYDVAAENIELTGDPLTIKDESGAVLTGKRAFYDLEIGVARLAGAEP
jgi:lipopolysaccharide export system protein LptA